MKTCSRCYEDKDETDFPRNGSNRRRPECGACKGKYDKEYRSKNKKRLADHNAQWRKENSEAIKIAKQKYYAENHSTILQRGKNYNKKNRDRVRVSLRKRKYGLSAEAFHEMLVNQLGCCAICAKPMQKIHVDHSHKTGAVRGLLCGKCNCGIGQLQDSPDLLRLAAAYLERS